MVDIIIIGAGPAGLTAALYALRAGKKVLVFEALAYGGKITEALEVENYPAVKRISGFDWATNLFNQVKDLGAEIVFEKVVDIKDLNTSKVVVTNQKEYEAKAIIIATGVQTRKLGLENEDKFLGHGLSYCATCDGAFFKGKVVAVNGGANTAVNDALFLANYCSKVYLIYRNEALRGENIIVEKLKKCNNVEYIFNTDVTKLNGKDFLESITIFNKKENKERDLDISCLFVAIGSIPENNNFSKLIELDDQGYILADESCKTNVFGIYAAGDTRKKNVRQLTTATADGTVAALTAIKEMK